MSDRLPWFRCTPSALLGAMAGLQPDESLIYITVLMRIYETGGPIADSARTLARRTGITERRAANAIEGLSMARKITVLSDERIDSSSTHAELTWQRERRADKSGAGRASAEARADRARIDKIAEGSETVVKFPKQKGQRNQRPTATAVEQMMPDKEQEEENNHYPPREPALIPMDWQPSPEDIEVARRFEVTDQDLPREVMVFIAHMREQKIRDAEWRHRWVKFIKHYQPSKPPPSDQRGARRRQEIPVSAHAANVARIAEKLSSAPPTGDLSNVTGPDPDEIIDLDDGGGDEPGALLLEFAGDGPGNDDEPSGAPGAPGAPGAADPAPTRGEGRGIPWASGGGSNPSDQVLAAAGYGGRDLRSARALRRARPPGG